MPFSPDIKKQLIATLHSNLNNQEVSNLLDEMKSLREEIAHLQEENKDLRNQLNTLSKPSSLAEKNPSLSSNGRSLFFKLIPNPYVDSKDIASDMKQTIQSGK